MASQGDLLSIFDEFNPADDLTADLSIASRAQGLDEEVLAELANILGWDDVGASGESDVAVLGVVAKALALGMPADALMQIVHVFADAMDRLADAEVRTYHDYIHERFRARGLTGPGLLEANQAVGKPLLELAEPDASDLTVATWCNLDFPLARMWGGQLERHGTLARGAERCDFRFRADAARSQGSSAHGN